MGKAGAMALTRIDLNSDLGEGYGVYRIGDDEAMLAIVSSANVACGFHAGDPEIMARCFTVARSRGVAIGAHPGLPDIIGFGRRRIPFSAGEIERLFAYQIGAAQALAAYVGHTITYVKPHGALANIAETDREVADAMVRATRAVDPGLAFLAIALSEQARAAEAAGLRTVAEVFADRNYADSGRLLPRELPGALITDPAEAASRTVRMVEARAILTADGTALATDIGSVCVHSDAPGAVERARHVRRALEAAGIRVASFSEP